MNLREVWQHHGWASDKGSAHSYIEWYDEALAPYRETATAVLEIGVFHGASLDMWREYFTKARIVGVDFNPHIPEAKQDEWYRRDVHVVLRVDAYTHSTVRTIAGFAPDGYDVIIDDGSHIEEHQHFVLREYFKLLKPGGLLVIEDVQLSAPNGHGELLNNLIRTAALELEHKGIDVVDRQHVIGRYDDILLVVKK